MYFSLLLDNEDRVCIAAAESEILTGQNVDIDPDALPTRFHFFEAPPSDYQCWLY